MCISAILDFISRAIMSELFIPHNPLSEPIARMYAIESDPNKVSLFPRHHIRKRTMLAFCQTMNRPLTSEAQFGQLIPVISSHANHPMLSERSWLWARKSWPSEGLGTTKPSSEKPLSDMATGDSPGILPKAAKVLVISWNARNLPPVQGPRTLLSRSREN